MIREVSVEECYPVYRALPEFEAHLTLQKITARVGDQALALISVDDGQAVGFKLGYRLNDIEFYSWLGGVAPAMRGRGIAAELLAAQEQWVRQRGYQRIRVKSMNRFPAMMRLLIGSGYQIDGIETGNTAAEHKILFSKWVKSSPV